ncbi:ABC transporter permease [Escherichia coli]|nr:ABC transporter permease [Escherichia coli]
MVSQGRETGKKKQLASGYLVNVHTAPDKSVRLRVALYFVNIFSRRNRGDLFRQPYNGYAFFVHQLRIFMKGDHSITSIEIG